MLESDNKQFKPTAEDTLESTEDDNETSAAVNDVRSVEDISSQYEEQLISNNIQLANDNVSSEGGGG